MKKLCGVMKSCFLVYQAAGRSPARSMSARCRKLDLPKGRKEAIVAMRVSGAILK